jgi:hypothetical protein
MPISDNTRVGDRVCTTVTTANCMIERERKEAKKV